MIMTERAPLLKRRAGGRSWVVVTTCVAGHASLQRSCRASHKSTAANYSGDQGTSMRVCKREAVSTFWKR
jgi:hypothetical protein